VVDPCGGGWALRAGIGMTFPSHPTLVAQRLAMNGTHFIQVVFDRVWLL